MAKKFKWDIRSNNGEVTEGNEWAKKLAEKIAVECDKHGKGFIFAPWGGSEMTCKSFFATSHQNPMMFGAGMAMMLSNYMKANPDLPKKYRKEWLKGIIKTALEVGDED